MFQGKPEPGDLPGLSKGALAIRADVEAQRRALRERLKAVGAATAKPQAVELDLADIELRVAAHWGLAAPYGPSRPRYEPTDNEGSEA